MADSQGNLLSNSARKVQDALQTLGMTLKVVELPDSTRTAAEAAQAIGTTVAQIAKSLVFKTANSHRPVLIIASGPNRVNEKKIGELLGEAIEKADADFVRNRIGFVIGGVPPVGHLEKPETLIDEDLFQYTEIWAAAGTSHAVFRLVPDDLVRMTSGRVVAVK